MKCVNCGNEIGSNYAVCPFCGARKTENANLSQNQSGQNAGANNFSYCAGCGVKIPYGYKLCPSCTERHIPASNNQVKIKPEKKNNGIIIAIIVVIIIGALVAVGGYMLITSDDSKTGITSTDTGGGNGEIIIPGNNGGNSDSGESGGSESGDSETPVPENKSEYEVVFTDSSNSLMSWDEANRKANRMGGQIVCVNSYEEFRKVCEIADNEGLYMFWLGARRKNGQDWERAKWADGSPITYTKWFKNEPSYSFEGAEERYLMAIKNGGEWYFNDSFGDVSDVYDLERYRYRLACIVEITK